MNHVRLYSNGTAVISREYFFNDQQSLRITIPVRKTDLDDVVSSLSVFGDVTITEPPTYTPTNARESDVGLNPDGVLQELAMELAGASVEVDAGSTYTGKLVGFHRQRRETNGSVFDSIKLLVLTEKGMQPIEESSITAIRFTDHSVRAEIDKSLESRLNDIKPSSSTVEMTVQPKSSTTSAIVTYATPVAAWKIRYQLRLSPGGAELDGQAVVDNDTDDDWTETLITVITGEPITFSTDLAEIRRPLRSRVNIVSDRAIGAVESAPVMSIKSREDVLPDLSMEVDDLDRSPAQKIFAGRRKIVGHAMARAVQPKAEVHESGDFSVFTSPDPVNVGAKRSAIIPLFRTDLGEALAVLFYKESDDPLRPFRAVRFKNQTAHSLGRGVCEVFVEGEFQGKCVLDPTKPGEESLLIHAKETGVKVFKENGRFETRRMAIRITQGTVYEEALKRVETSYRVQNSHASSFVLEIEHLRSWPDGKLEVSVSSGNHEAFDIPNGQRIRVTLEAKGNLTMKVEEETVEQQNFSIGITWLARNEIELKAPSSQSRTILACIELQKKIEGILAEIHNQEDSVKAIGEEQERLIKLIPNGHVEQANAWKTDLASAEAELRELKRNLIPKRKAELRNVRDSLAKALADLSYEWKADKKGTF